MIDPTDFCPGCNSIRCTCEEEREFDIGDDDELDLYNELMQAVEEIKAKAVSDDRDRVGGKRAEAVLGDCLKAFADLISDRETELQRIAESDDGDRYDGPSERDYSDYDGPCPGD